MPSNIIQRLQALDRRRDDLAPGDFTSTEPNTQGSKSRIARFRAATACRVIDGRNEPFRLALPCYESFTSDGTTGNSETFTLSHSLVNSPNTHDVVVWEGSRYVGEPTSVTYGAGGTASITFSPQNANSNIHVYHVSGEAATLEVQKAIPSGSTASNEKLFSANAGLAAQTNQAQQPEYFALGESNLMPFIATDMTLDVYVDAPYTVRFSDPNGDGTTATNALMHIPLMRGADSVQGLKQAIKADMGSR